MQLRMLFQVISLIPRWWLPSVWHPACSLHGKLVHSFLMRVDLQVAFGAEFLRSRIEKERKAVLAEAQMMNTIEYRMDCQLLKYLHEENNLGHRFPIGMVDQVCAFTLLLSRVSLLCLLSLACSQRTGLASRASDRVRLPSPCGGCGLA